MTLDTLRRRLTTEQLDAVYRTVWNGWTGEAARTLAELTACTTREADDLVAQINHDINERGWTP